MNLRDVSRINQQTVAGPGPVREFLVRTGTGASASDRRVSSIRLSVGGVDWLDFRAPAEAGPAPVSSGTAEPR